MNVMDIVGLVIPWAELDTLDDLAAWLRVHHPSRITITNEGEL